jgi:3-phosphoshikimate 1-carboxyvinyltransferase
MTLFINKQKDFKNIEIELPASKSISNRVLIIDALAKGNSQIHNISSARDTQTMLRLLKSKEYILDVIDAGTTMRFLTAYLSITNQKKILTGSERMKQRPISILVDSLCELGAQIDYNENVGFPPISINDFKDNQLKTITIKGNVSSQYISAILMIAPLLKHGLNIILSGKIGSRPYIDMTLAVMKSYGVNSVFNGNDISIAPQQYIPTNYTVEPDWSAVSYWYSFVALSKSSEILIKDLRLPAIQGDSVLVDIMTQLGVKTTFNNKGALLSKIPSVKSFVYDFTDCPDLAQTIAVICSAKGIQATFTGLESLRIKETDRISALQNELTKIGSKLEEKSDHWTITPSHKLPIKRVDFETYEDHRMAMAFAPLALLMDVTIEDENVVKKSYPSFWTDLEMVGFTLVRK